MKKTTRRNNLNKNIWPIYLKDPVKDLSSFALDVILLSHMSKMRHKFQIENVIELKDYTYNPLTKVYIKHKSFNCGIETHFFLHNGSILGSAFIQISDERISNWKVDIMRAKVVEFLKHSLMPLEIVKSDDPNLFNDNYSIKAGYCLHMEIEGEDFRLIAVNVYLDLSHDLGKVISKL